MSASHSWVVQMQVCGTPQSMQVGVFSLNVRLYIVVNFFHRCKGMQYPYEHDLRAGSFNKTYVFVYDEIKEYRFCFVVTYSFCSFAA